MKTKVSPTARKLKWLAPLLVLVFVAGVAYAADRFLIPQDMNLPYYARGLGETDTVAVMVLYSLPGDIPGDANLMPPRNVYPGRNPDTLLVQGFTIMGASPPPIQVKLTNVPGKMVPIAFADPEDAQAAQADGTLTIGEVLGISHIGWADFYQETLHPGKMLEVVANGHLEGGQPFFVHTSNGTTVVHIGE